MSPGVFITEIDNSQLPKEPTAMGPAVIGRFERGPSLKPVQVNSFVEFLDIFGAPNSGQAGADVWRNGSFAAPTYAAYAAQAWFRNNSPVTVVRLAGQTSTSATENSAFAGWQTTKQAASDVSADNGGAFGLFVCEGPASNLTGAAGSGSSFVSASSNYLTGAAEGTLAAIWYINNGAIALSGVTSLSGTTTHGKAMAQWVRAVGTGAEFKVVIENGAGDTQIDSAFNFDRNSPSFLRKVFNTNPTLTNSNLTSTDGITASYWLGESYEGNLDTFRGATTSSLDGNTGENKNATGISGTIANETYGIMLRLSTPNGSVQGGDFTMSDVKSPLQQFAKTGWFISQDVTTNTASYLPANMQKLFRFAARELGSEIQNKVKISISRLAASNDPNWPWGTFTVLVRDISDTDASPRILEQFNNCNLNPSSDDYLAKKVGNKFLEWDDIDRRYRYYGEYTNVSDYLYVEINETVDRGACNAEYLPFGVFGPPRYQGFAVSGTTMFDYDGDGAITSGDADGPFVGALQTNPITTMGSGTFTGSAIPADSSWLFSGAITINSRYKFPQLRLRSRSDEGGALTDPKDAYFGVDTTYNSTRFDASVLDVLRTKADDIQSWDAQTGKTETSWIFSLDDVRNVNVLSGTYTGSYDTQAIWWAGSRVSGSSYTAHTGSSIATVSGSDADPKGPMSASYRNVIDDNPDFGNTTAGWNQFTTCLHGGCNGLDIKEREPFNSRTATDGGKLGSGATNKSSAPFNSLNVAIDSLRDPEIVEYNLVTMPGIVNNTLNQKLIDMCERRGDALAIIDLKNGYTPAAESGADRQARKGSVTQVIRNRVAQQFNSSYGCAYYPWVQIRDTISGATLWAPPSIVALGAMSYGQANSQLWFAPAGFTRGGLSERQAGGIPVVGVEERLTTKKRDDLYEAGINPIAAFPAEGIVIFGQKTLQLTPSALDRINVRRLVIFLKKQISRFAATILFDQNVQATWVRFKSKVVPFLSDVKAGLGVTDYKVVLDESTTTADLIDRNIMYAKIYVKPARAIEFIAIDFIITDSGASFED
jgi:hypothetical protein